ncbi:hypothetical protein Sru01_36970 [Sphaerisporangium rufum]|uniref:Fibronectin type-III domain-containing protein n=1 Tax=Sphaerisporangium rufum TaxID=1381558 RepID=A0A919R5L1_9ACTN|nr:fibronectin type III domain-containing protein [Sphaerisporangium rufum]GII78715.1 hypothetical protein Sru01_36970 [Sphaerisporangium rufum]
MNVKIVIPAVLAAAVGGAALTGAAAAATVPPAGAPERAPVQPYPPVPVPVVMTLSASSGGGGGGTAASVADDDDGEATTTANLEWTPGPPGTDSYDIYRAASPFTLIATVPGRVLSYLDSGLAPRIRYHYYILARDAAGEPLGRSNVAELTKPNRTFVIVESGHKVWFETGEVDRRGGGGYGRDAYGRDGYGYGGGDFGGPGRYRAEGGLPFTGAPIAMYAGLGGVLVLTGGAAVVVARRRRAARAR